MQQSARTTIMPWPVGFEQQGMSTLFPRLAIRRFLLKLLLILPAMVPFAPPTGVVGHVWAATLAAVTAGTSPASSSSGNKGTIKIAENPAVDEPPAGGSNEPHATCPFWIQGYKFPVRSGTLSVSVQAPAVSPQTVGQVIIDKLPWSGTPQAGGYFFNMPTNAAGFGWANGFVSGGHYEVDITDALNDKNKVFFTVTCAAPPDTPTSTPTATATATPVTTLGSPPQPASTLAPTATPFSTVTRQQDPEITRTTTRVKVRVVAKVKVRVVVKTVRHYRTVTRIKHVTVVRYRIKVVTRYRTVTRLVTTFRYLQDPKTGLLAHPPAWQGAPPVADTDISIPRLNITRAPVWNRGFVSNGVGTFTYDIVNAYGVTRFAPSARFGQNGLTLTYAHDDLGGDILRYLDTMRTGDIVSVYQGRHVYRYVVRLVRIVAPNDVTLLNATWTKPTLAMVSCWPFMVDTNRVVVIAQME